MQVADKSAHEASFANAGCQGKAKRRKVSFEIGDGWEFALDCRKRGMQISVLLGWDNLCDSVENFQRLSLRRSQAETACYGVDVSIHDFALSPSKSI